MSGQAARPVRLGIVAGETSGDQLGGGLMRELSARYAAQGRALQFSGIGGTEMCAAGLQSLAPLESLAVNGFVEPLKRLPALLKLLGRVADHCRSVPVDAFIGIDFNVFNLLLERQLHRAGLPTVHYVSPSVYAWRRGRTRALARSTDLLLTLYPFEPAFYSGLAVKAVCVGHPLASVIPVSSGGSDARRAARKQLDVGLEATLVALLPGSRRAEIVLMTPLFLDAAKILHEKTGAIFVLPCVRPELGPLLESLLAGYPDLPVRLVHGNAREALTAADGALVKSGTGTLEAMCIGRPMVVSYRLGRWSYQLARRLVRTPFVALPNILAGEAVVPELLQDAATPARLAESLLHEMQRAVDEPEYLDRFRVLHESLVIGGGANQEAAKVVHGFLQERGV